MRKFFKWAFISTAILCVLLLALSIALPIIYQDEIRAKLRTELDKRVHADISFDDVSMSFFRHFPNLSLHLHGLRVVGRDEFVHDTLMQMKRFGIALNTHQLLRGRIDLEKIILNTPQLYVRVLKSGKTNYDILIPQPEVPDTMPGTELQPIDLECERWQIKEGNLRYEDDQRNVHFVMTGLNHQGRGIIEHQLYQMTSETKINDLELAMGGVQYIKRKHFGLDFTVVYDHAKRTIFLQDNHIQLNDLALGLAGSVGLLPDGGYQLDLTLAAKETEFANILSLVPGPFRHEIDRIKTRGKLSCTGLVKGVLNLDKQQWPQFNIETQVHDAMFQYPDLPQAVEDIRLHLVVSNNTGNPWQTVLDLKTLHARAGKNKIDARLLVQNFKNAIVDAEVNMALDMAEVERYYPVQGLALTGNYNLTARAKGQFRDFYRLRGTQYEINPQGKLPPFFIDLVVDKGTVKYDHLPLPMEDIHFELTAENKDGEVEHTRIHLERMGFKMDRNLLRGQVLVQGLSKPMLDGEIFADIDLEEVQHFYPLDSLQAKGELDLDCKFKGVLAMAEHRFPVVDLKMKWLNGYLKSTAAPVPVERIHLIAEAVNNTGHVNDTQLRIDTLTYAVADEPFVLSGTVNNLNDPNYDLFIKGKLDFDHLTNIFPIEHARMRGDILVDIETRGRLSDYNAGRFHLLHTTGTVELKSFSFFNDEVPKGLRINDALLRLAPNKLVLERMDCHLGRSNMNIRGDLYNYLALVMKGTADTIIRGDLMLVCDTLDLNQFMASGPVRVDAAPAPAQGAAAPPAPPDQDLRSFAIPRYIEFIFDSEIKNVLVDELVINNLKGEITVRNGVVSMKETGFNTMGSEFDIGGHYDSRNLKRPKFDFELDIKNLDINKAYRASKLIQAMAPAAEHTYGIVNLSYRIQGELDEYLNPLPETLQGGGEVAMVDAKIQGMKLFSHMGRHAKNDSLHNPSLKGVVMVTEIKNGKVTVKPFSFKVSGFHTEVEGTQFLNGMMDFLVRITLPPFGIKVPFHVSGHYDDPKVRMGKHDYGKGPTDAEAKPDHTATKPPPPSSK